MSDTNQAMTERPARSAAAQAMIEVKAGIDAREAEFAAALPAHMPVERFKRVVLTAVQNNPDLINPTKVERRSLFTACMKAAQDGLLPDGRDGAIVPYKGVAQWLPMIGGIQKKARNSGEIVSWNAYVVFAKDGFEYQLGDEPFIRHKPSLEKDRGALVAAYSICALKAGGISREIMTRGEIDKVKAASRASNNGPWVTWYDEMARKTVMRRHSKRLPMSSDLDDLIRRDDHMYDLEGARDVAQIARPKGLHAALDMLAAGGAAAPSPDDEPGAPEPTDSQLDAPARANETPAGDAPRADGQDAGAVDPGQSRPEAPASDISDDDFPGDRPSARPERQSRDKGAA